MDRSNLKIFQFPTVLSAIPMFKTYSSFS